MSAPACVTCLTTKESSRLHVTTPFARLTLPLFYRYSGVIAVSIAVLCFLRVKKTPIHLAVYRRWRTGVLRNLWCRGSPVCLELGEDRYDRTGYAVDVAIASIVPGHEQAAKPAFRIAQERHQPLYFPQRIFRFHLDFARLARLDRGIVVKREPGGNQFLRIAAVQMLQA